ncbi:MAG: hypothetical protein Q4A00_03990 [Flavobacteriaceae bacterium]|nr:hypothetical protein [Flavobacteriaceae bacterium]
MSGFNNELADHLSKIYLRAKADKKFISRILDIKEQVIEGQEVHEENVFFINRILDDMVKITQICETNYKEFGRYVFTNADIDCFLEAHYVGDEALKNAEKSLSQAQKHLKSE